MANNPTLTQYLTLLNELGNGDTSFPGFTVVRTSPTADQQDGFDAVALRDNTTKEVIIVNLGFFPNPLTTLGRGAASADGNILLNKTPSALNDAAAFAAAVETQVGGHTPIYVDGNSLGGAEAQREAQILVGLGEFSGGATFGAPGLPQNSTTGPSTLVNYLLYGDAVAAYTTDPGSPEASLFGSGQSMLHYGTQYGATGAMLGNPQAANILRRADLNTFLDMFASSASMGGSANDAAVPSLLGMVASAVVIHHLPLYASALGVTLPPTPSDIELQQLFQYYGLPFGSPGEANAAETTIASDGDAVSPDLTASYNSTTNQVTITQTENMSSVFGVVDSGGVTTLSFDPATSLIDQETYASPDGTVYTATVSETTGNIQSLEANENNGASYQINYTYNTDGSIQEVATAYSGSNLAGSVQFAETTNISATGQASSSITVDAGASATISGTDNTIVLGAGATISSSDGAPLTNDAITFKDSSGNSLTLGAGTFAAASSYTNSGTQTVTILKPDGNQLGVLTFNTSSDTASFTVTDGFNSGDLTVTLPNISGNKEITADAAGTDPLQVLKDYLGDLGYTLTSAQITALTTAVTGFSTSLMGDDSATATASGQTLKAREGVDTLTGYSGGGDTFQADDGLATGSTVTGHGSGNTMVSGGDIAGASVSGVQTLQIGDGVAPNSITLTASQFNGFGSIFSPTTFAGTISTSGGGTYDIGAATVGSVYTYAVADAAATTLNSTGTDMPDANDASYIISGNGNDTVTAASGNITITGGGNDTVNTASGTVMVSGDGNDTINASGAASITVTGAGTDTITAGNSSGVNITVGNGTDTATAGSGAGDSLTATTGGNTLIAGNGAGDTFTAQGGDNVMQAGNGGSTFNIYDDDNTATATGGNNTFNLLGASGLTDVSGTTIDLAGSVINGGTGGSNTINAAGGTTLVMSDDDGSISHIQSVTGMTTLDINADQMAALSSLGFGGFGNTLNAESSGTYNLAAIDSADKVSMIDASTGGPVTLINNDADGAEVIGSNTGDTLTVGNGAHDTILALTGSGDTITAGTGTGDVIEAFGFGETVTVNGDSANVTMGNGTATINGNSDHITVFASGANVALNGTGEVVNDTDPSGGDKFVVGGGASEAGASITGKNNIYTFVSNFGTDTLTINGGSANAGHIVFGSGATAQNLWFAQSGNDLQIDLMGTNESVTVHNWFSGSGSQADDVILSNGNQLTNAEVAGLVSAMATYQAANPSFDPTATSSLPSDTTLQAAVTTAWASEVTIADTAANVAAELDYLETLAAAGKLASITITNPSTPLSITVGQLTSDATALGLISGSYSLAVSGVTAANAATVAGDAHVTSVSVTDSAANVTANLSALQGVETSGELGSILLTDPAPPTLTVTETQLGSDAGALSKITGSYDLSVTGVLAADAASVAAESHVTSVSVSDTAANVTAHIAALETLATSGALASIALTGTPALTFNAATAAANADALSLLTGTYTLTVSDSAANVASNIDALGTLAAIGVLTAVTFTDSSKPTLSITGAQAEADAAIFSVITSAYTVTLQSDTVATFISNDDTVNLDGSGNDVTLTGSGGIVNDFASDGGNTITLAGADSAWVFTTGDTVIATASGTGAFVLGFDGETTASLSGSDQYTSLYAANSGITLNGNDEQAYLYNNSQSAIVASTGTDDTVDVSGTSSTANFEGTGGTVNDSKGGNVLTLGGSGNTANVSGATADTVNITGTSDSVSDYNSAGGNTITLGNSDNAYLYAANDIVSATGSNVNVYGFNTGENVTFTGASDYVVLFGADSSVALNGTNGQAYLYQDSQTGNSTGDDNTLTVGGTGNSVTVSGESDVVNESGTGSNSITLSGTDDSGFINANNSDTLTVGGTSNTMKVTTTASDGASATVSGLTALLEFSGASDDVITFDSGATGTLKLDTAQSFTGTVAGLADDDSIDLSNFHFSGSPTISGVTGTGDTGTATTVTITDGTTSTQLALINQFANQYAVSSSAYTLAADGTGGSAGTLFQLAAGH